MRPTGAATTTNLLPKSCAAGACSRIRMNIHFPLGLGAIAMFLGQPRVTERQLADIAVIALPASLKNEESKSYRTDQMGRLSFAFSSAYFWASFSSATAYKQLMIVSVMAPNATDGEYAAVPHRMNLNYDDRKTVRTTVVGSGSLTVLEGVYKIGNLREPAYQFVYFDRARRVQLAWHAVKKEVELETGVAQISRMASSFRILRDPAATFIEMRNAPRKEEESRAGKLMTVKEMLLREGYGAPEPGKPVMRNGVYLEWTSDPEPRYQMLMPLGRVRAPANGAVVGRPRPVPVRAGDVPGSPLAGVIGWRDVTDGEWQFMNSGNDYLPFKGTAALLAAQQHDRAFVYFYYAATVRVEEELRDERLTSTKWFLNGLPEVLRRWKAGTLVTPGKPEND